MMSLRKMFFFMPTSSWADPEGGQTLSPLKIMKNMVSKHTGPFPFIITKLPSQHSMLGHHRHASETLFKWCFAGRPMIGRIYSVVVF